MTPRAHPYRTASASSLRGAARSLISDGPGSAVGGALALVSALAFAAGAGWATRSGIRAARAALPQLPALVPEVLVERFLAAGLVSAAFLLVLGALTTAVSTLFLSPDMEALVPLPIPHARLFGREVSRTVLSASAPALLLAVPILAVAAASSPRPLLAAVAGLSVLAAVLLGAGLVGSALALLLVRLVPPRRARLFAASISALGLSAALFGARGARPERLFDPVEALALLERLGSAAPARSPFDPFAAGAHAVTQALFGDIHGLRTAVLLLAASAALAAVVATALAPIHLRLWRDTRESPAHQSLARDSGRPVRSLGTALLRAETASLLRDASSPAQIGSLATVFLLQLLNLRLLPAGDASSRDALAGLETGLALFLVAALSLRFGTPAVSSDGRAALVLRTLPLSPRRHLLVRTAVRVVPAILAVLVLVGAGSAVLRPSPAAVAASLAAGLAGALVIPALHVGLGALSPRYDAPSAVAVALGPAGLLALVLSTALALVSTLVVSAELRMLGSALFHVPLGRGAVAALFLGTCVLAAVLPLALGSRALARRDLSGS